MTDAIIRPMDLERDAARLAVLFNESEPAWPGGLTDGIPLCEQEVREWMASERCLVVFVAEADDRLVGFCSFMENTPWPSGQYGSGYLDLLNVHPGYHGRSIGRRLIQATIERSVQEGWVYQTLGTWSANLKAVPTYKKTGHFWRPDSSVWMQNYIPAALQMPLARPFFDRHDWYRSYVRALEQHPDDQRWEGLKVCTEHWEAEGESLTIWIDRQANAPCAIETDDVFVAAIPAEIEPLQGTSVSMNWRIKNKTDAPIHVHLQATGADGLEIDHREGYVVPPGLAVDHVAQVKITDQAPHEKLDGTAPVVRSIVTLDHNEVELFSGLAAKRPLSVDSAPASLSLAPGVPTSVLLQVHSELAAAQALTCYVLPAEGLTCDWSSQAVTVEPSGHAALPLTVTAARPGVYALQVRLVPGASELATVREELTLFCVTPGGVLSAGSGEEARVETDALRYTVAGRMGAVTIVHKDTERTVLKATPVLGPPNYPGEFDKNHFTVRADVEGEAAIVRLEAEPQHYSDCLMSVTYTIYPSGLMTVEEQLRNRGGQPYEGRVAISWDRSLGSGSQITLPLAQGLVQAPLSVYPRSWTDAPREPSAYSEPWVATEAGGLAAGVAWDGSVEQLSFEQGVRSRGPVVHLGRGEATPVIRGACWAGVGDWATAREALMHWAGLAAGARGSTRAHPRPVAQARMVPAVVATLQDAVEAEIAVDSVSILERRGELTVAAQDGLMVAPQSVAIDGLSRGNDRLVSLKVQVPGAVRGYQAEANLALQDMSSASNFEVLRLGHPGEVHVHQEVRSSRPVWVVDNGASRFAIAQDFGPSLISWLWAGEEQVWSPFPEPVGLAWCYPWYGGVQPLVWLNDDAEGCGNLVSESFQADPVTVRSAGLAWTGLRLSTRPARKELADLGIEVDYLTLPHSPALKMILRIRNLRATRQVVLAGANAQASLGATMADLTLRGEQMYRQPTIFASDQSSQAWGAVTLPATGATMLGVSPQRHLRLRDWGASGRYLSLQDEMHLAGGAQEAWELYLVRCDDYATALSLRGLARLES